jgi:glucose-6-phosphate 1-dehydrogenase
LTACDIAPTIAGMQNTLQPTILVIFGVTGDLAKRYLLPSIYHLYKQELLPEKFEIVGVSRRNIDLDEIFNKVEMCVSENDNICDPVVMARMHSHTRIQQLDMDDPQAYKDFLEQLNAIEAEQGVCMDRLFYLSIPPSAYQNVIHNMGEAGFRNGCDQGGEHTGQSRLLAEKPFGSNLETAKELVATTAAAFDEEQIFRIDHYLAKETAQNILTFRFENRLFESIWNNRHITALDIVASEKIGIEGRAEFYEQQGALRDFVQNHLMQLLAIVTMERPEQMDSAGIHAAKLQALQAIQPITDKAVASHAQRGQYNGYRQEAGNDKSFVETYAAIQLQIDSDPWEGVPVTIRTGKSMAERYTTITVSFAEAGDNDNARSNDLQFRIQPNEGIQLSLLAKKPGYGFDTQPVTMDFSYQQSFVGGEPTAYERVLIDAIRGDRTLFASSDEVLAAWNVLDSVVAAWAKNDKGLLEYEPGTDINDIGSPIDESQDETV